MVCCPSGTTPEQIVLPEGLPWRIVSGVEAAKHEMSLEHDAVRNAPLSTLTSFRSHKGGEHDQHTRFVQEIGSRCELLAKLQAINQFLDVNFVW